MRRPTRLWASAVLVTMVGATDAGAQVTPANYDRAMGLRDRWMYLTENVADPATWVDGTSRFYYRKTVKGGFQFVMVDAQTLQRQPAFDHDRLAVALGAATGEKYSGLRLPFDTFRFSGGERAIEIIFNESAWTCRLPVHLRQPSGWRRSWRSATELRHGTRHGGRTRQPAEALLPDGRWEAFVSNYNLVVRLQPGRQRRRSATTARKAMPTTRSRSRGRQTLRSLRHIAYRPGYRRIVHRVESSPADQVQPRLLTQLHAKPGDAVDVDQPRVFHVTPRDRSSSRTSSSRIRT